MSDLSSNSMSRDEIIRNARANCMRYMDNPKAYPPTENKPPIETPEHTGFKRGTYIRLFLSCMLLLGLLAVKQTGYTWQNYGFGTIVTLVEDNSGFEKLQNRASRTLEEDVLPTFKLLKSNVKIGK